MKHGLCIILPEATLIEIGVYKNIHFFATMDPKRIIKMSWKVLYAVVEVLRHAIPWHLLACIFQVRHARLRPEATMRNQFYLK